MQRLRDTFRRKQTTLESQAKAEANKIQQQKQQLQGKATSSSTHGSSGGSGGGGGGGGGVSSGVQNNRSPNNSTVLEDILSNDPSPPLSPARNETSLSFGSNLSNDELEEEEDEFDESAPGMSVNEYLYHTYSRASSASPLKMAEGDEQNIQKSCLEVPHLTKENESARHMRSASFDESRNREITAVSGENACQMGYSNLNVPDSNFRSGRSRSFDYAAVKSNAATGKSARSTKQQQYRGTRTDSTTSGPSTFLDVPKWKLLIRRPSTTAQSVLSDSVTKDCVHCVLLDELNRSASVETCSPTASDSLDSECSSYNEEDEKECETLISDAQSCEGGGTDLYEGTAKMDCMPPLLHTDAVNEFLIDEFIEPIEGLPIVTLCPPEADSPSRIEENDDTGNGITVISLEVPVLSGSKQARSASVDSPYLLQVPKRTDIEVREGPPKARSKSVDIVLPTTAGGPYLIVPPLRQPPATTKKTIQGEITIQAENGETRVLRSAPDWTESAINGDHFWVSSSTSGSDLCYVGERECSKTGPRLSCPACKVTAHTGCISILIDKLKIQCKPTFKDGVRQYREQQIVKHHWVHRRHEKGRCKACGKSFQSKLTFSSNKEIVAISCSWCKSAYHNKSQCYNESLLGEACEFGIHAKIVVPPTWIVKLPRKGSFKSSIRRAPRSKRLSSKRRSKNKDQTISTTSGAASQLNPSTSTSLLVSSVLACSQEKLVTSSVNSDSSSTLASIGSSCISSSPSSVISSLQPEDTIDLRSASATSVTLPEQQQQQQQNTNQYGLASNSTVHHGHGSHHQHSHLHSHPHPHPHSHPHPVPHSHYYSKHNHGDLYSNAANSVSSRRQYRRHSHANVSASSINSSLLTAESKESSLNYPHSNASLHYIHTVQRCFAIKPIPSANLKPLLVFINPKSGGNQGAKLMQKFQWHLNPRQVFDLSQGGPRLGLDLYKKVHNLRILACGGDGTAGWVLSAIDEIGIQPPPPISVLPLGTGNDLARSFNWGGSYTDEPVSKILCNIQEGEVVQLDRWNLTVKRNPDVPFIAAESKGAKADLPLNVVNNYFSIGVDAHIALSFHEAREAHPERFNSRLRNKMFYGQAGGKDLLQRKWKDLCNYVYLECDGLDYTGRLKDLKVHSVLFLNIPSYGGGTRPWAPSANCDPQSTDDGRIEVIGLTTYQLPFLQAGGHGTCIAQCKSAKIITTRTIPMQVDGEPCRLLPSLIQLELRNKANLIAKTKSTSQHRQMPTLEKITLKVRKLNLADYEAYHYDKDRLREISVLLGTITSEQNLELIHVRTKINDLMKEKGLCIVGTTDSTSSHSMTHMNTTNNSNSTNTSKLSPTNVSPPSTSFTSSAYVSSSVVSNKFVSNDWCFVDSCTAERFFRIDRAQEHLHYVVDICNEDLYILDPQFDEKDDTVDLFTPDEVIADVETVGQSEEQCETGFNDLTSDNLTINSLPLNDICDSCSQEENGNTNFLQTSLSDTSTPADTTGSEEQQDRLSFQENKFTSKSSNVDTRDTVRVNLTVDLSSKFPNQNGSIGLSPLSSPSSFFTCSPPRSPRRHQKVSHAGSTCSPSELMFAAQNGDVSSLKQLHHKGANLMVADENGLSALHHAAIKGHDKVVSFLLNAFTSEMVDLADPIEGHTALHKAVINGHKNICTMLVLRGAKIWIKDKKGYSAEDLALQRGQTELAATLTHIYKANSRETTV